MTTIAQKKQLAVPASYPKDGLARRWTIEEYYCLADTGILHPDERVELIEGEIIQTLSPIGAAHFTATLKTAQVLQGIFGEAHTIRSQGPLTLADGSEPVPDVLVARGTLEDYADHHPRPKDVILLVEISDATLDYDRIRKGLLYARGEIAEYWIVNLSERRLEVQRKPSSEGYLSRDVLPEPDSVAPLFAPGRYVQVTDLLPARPSRKIS